LKKHSVESVLDTLKGAIAAQAIVIDLARRGIGGGSLAEHARPTNWLAYLPADERVNFLAWLWAVARPSEDDEPRATTITAQAGFCLRVIASKLNLEAKAAA
jgi:hypothetical protein